MLTTRSTVTDKTRGVLVYRVSKGKYQDMFALNPDIRAKINNVTRVWRDSFVSDPVARLKKDQIDLSAIFTATWSKEGKYTVSPCEVVFVQGTDENSGEEEEEQKGQEEKEEEKAQDEENKLVDGVGPYDVDTLEGDDKEYDDEKTVYFGESGSEKGDNNEGGVETESHINDYDSTNNNNDTNNDDSSSTNTNPMIRETEFNIPEEFKQDRMIKHLLSCVRVRLDELQQSDPKKTKATEDDNN